MKRLLYYALLLFLFAGFSSCSKSDSAPPGGGATTTSFLATINGASEVPANASTATGSATLTFNTTTKVFTLVVNFTGVTANNAHIHKEAVGVSGGVVFPLTAVSPINYTSVPLTTQQEADLNANLYYVNIHSVAYPAGEIRGQLIKQ